MCDSGKGEAALKERRKIFKYIKPNGLQGLIFTLVRKCNIKNAQCIAK
jgi:hypothetical protein